MKKKSSFIKYKSNKILIQVKYAEIDKFQFNIKKIIDLFEVYF